MNLSQLRNLVKETEHLPDNTVLVAEAGGGTYDEVGIKLTTVLAFQKPRSLCPLGAVFHKPASAEAFGYSSDDALAANARSETVLEVV